MNIYYVYIMSSRYRAIYTGVTNDLLRRVSEHRHKVVGGFTKRYNMTRLIYFESFTHVGDAIAREKQIKGWSREKKIALIRSTNPEWNNLAKDWFSS